MVDVDHHHPREIGMQILAPGALLTFLINRGVEHGLETTDRQSSLDRLISRLTEVVNNRIGAFALSHAAKPLGSQLRHRTVNIL